MKWESKLIRDLTLLIVVCGLLFSGMSYINRLSLDKPSDEIFEALSKIPSSKVVFSDIGYGNWISYSGKKNVWDSFSNVEGFDEIEKDMNKLVESRDYFETKEILDKYEIEFILIDKDLREKWGGSGLLYLLRYNEESFKKIYGEDVEVWRYFK